MHILNGAGVDCLSHAASFISDPQLAERRLDGGAAPGSGRTRPSEPDNGDGSGEGRNDRSRHGQRQRRHLSSSCRQIAMDEAMMPIMATDDHGVFPLTAPAAVHHRDGPHDPPTDHTTAPYIPGHILHILTINKHPASRPSGTQAMDA